MGIILKADNHKGIIFDSYNNPQRVDMLNLETGDITIRMAKYASEEHRIESEGDTIDSQPDVYAKMSEEDLTIIKDILYKYINDNEKYKDGEKC